MSKEAQDFYRSKKVENAKTENMKKFLSLVNYEEEGKIMQEYADQQLRLLSVVKSVKDKEEIDFKIWAKENAGVPPESFYFYKGQWQTVKELRLIYNTSVKNQP